MKGLLGIKLGMTQVFDDKGVVTPVTIVQAGPAGDAFRQFLRGQDAPSDLG